MAKRPRRSGPTFIQRSRSVSSEQKAIYHQVMGAGPRGVRREFFDLNESDKNVATEMIDRMAQEQLNKL